MTSAQHDVDAADASKEGHSELRKSVVSTVLKMDSFHTRRSEDASLDQLRLFHLFDAFAMDKLFPAVFERVRKISNEEKKEGKTDDRTNAAHLIRAKIGDTFSIECRNGEKIAARVSAKKRDVPDGNVRSFSTAWIVSSDGAMSTTSCECSLSILPVTVNDENDNVDSNDCRVSSEVQSTFFVQWSVSGQGRTPKCFSTESCAKALAYLQHLVHRWNVLRRVEPVWCVKSAIACKDEVTKDDSTSEKSDRIFCWRKHVEYICTLGEKTESLEYYLTEHLRMSGIYWGLGALGILRGYDTLDRKKIIAFVRSCERPDGGFAGNVGHDAHILYTLSAVQILAMIDALEYIDASRVCKYICGLQNKDGSFCGDAWGEIDTRFSYCAACCLAILGKLDAIDVKMAVKFVMQCCNADGGFGVAPGSESHAGQVFCCLAMLSICGALDHVDANRLGWWLAERQCDSGGLNGRPEKQADVCYSWWTLSSLAILGRVNWIDRVKLEMFILGCQDPDGGGISDRPGDMVDIYHTYFGCCGLSLLGWFEKSRNRTNPVDPVYALPEDVVRRLKLTSQRF